MESKAGFSCMACGVTSTWFGFVWLRVLGWLVGGWFWSGLLVRLFGRRYLFCLVCYFILCCDLGLVVCLLVCLFVWLIDGLGLVLLGQVSLFVCLFVSFVCLLDLCNLMFSGFIPLGSMARQILLMSNDRNAECVHRRCWWHEINSFINENSSKQTKVQLTWWIPSKSINQLLPFVTWNDNPNGRSPTTSEKVT